jgi:hypothetical protein
MTNYQKLKLENPKKFEERRILYLTNSKRPKRVWNKYRLSSLERNIIFELTINDFETMNENKKCYYCGDEIDKVRLDRIDNKIGYTKENIVMCCMLCNFMKGEFNQISFIDQCKKIAKINCRRGEYKG